MVLDGSEKLCGASSEGKCTGGLESRCGLASSMETLQKCEKWCGDWSEGKRGGAYENGFMVNTGPMGQKACEGVVVVCKAVHMCMVARGVEKFGTATVSTVARGKV